MYKHLLKNLYEDLLTFDKEDCRKVQQLIKHLRETKEVPLKIIEKKTYDFYLGWCYSKKIEPMTEWQFELCRAEMSW